MNKTRGPALILAAAMAISGPARAQSARNEAPPGPTRVTVGLETGYDSRTVRWDDETSAIRTFTVGLASELEFPIALTARVFAGLGLTNYKGALFEDLPITLRYEAGSASGVVLGAEIRKKILTFGDFETGVTASFVTSLGAKKTWPLSGFAVDGEARGTPSWTAFEVGPTIACRRYRGITPFASIRASWFGGTFRMTETLGDLGGTQERKFKQKGLVRISLGAAGAVAPRLSLRGEATVTPAGGVADLGLAVRLLYAF